MKLIPNKAKSLTPRMMEIVQYYFANPFQTEEQIGQVFGISKSRVSQILTHDRVLDAFPALGVRKRRALTPKAIAIQERLLTQTENLEVSRKVMSELLQTNKVMEPETKVQVNVFAQMPTKDLVDRVSEAAKFSISNAIDGELVNPDEDSRSPTE